MSSPVGHVAPCLFDDSDFVRMEPKMVSTSDMAIPFATVWQRTDHLAPNQHPTEVHRNIDTAISEMEMIIAMTPAALLARYTVSQKEILLR